MFLPYSANTLIHPSILNGLKNNLDILAPSNINAQKSLLTLDQS